MQKVKEKEVLTGVYWFVQLNLPDQLLKFEKVTNHLNLMRQTHVSKYK